MKALFEIKMDLSKQIIFHGNLKSDYIKVLEFYKDLAESTKNEHYIEKVDFWQKLVDEECECVNKLESAYNLL